MDGGITDSVEEAMSGLHSKLERHEDSRQYYEEWKNVTGVDLSQHPFDFDKKRMFINGKYKDRTLNVLLLRMEDISEWESILAPIFPNFKLMPDNQANEKVYASFYSRFKSAFGFTQTEIDSILESSAELQFYRPSEHEQQMRKVGHATNGSISFTALSGSSRAANLNKARHMCDGVRARKTKSAARRLRRRSTKSQKFGA